MRISDGAKEWMVNDGSTGGLSPSTYRSQSLGGIDRALIGDQGVALLPTKGVNRGVMSNTCKATTYNRTV